MNLFYKLIQLYQMLCDRMFHHSYEPQGHRSYNSKVRAKKALWKGPSWLKNNKRTSVFCNHLHRNNCKSINGRNHYKQLMQWFWMVQHSWMVSLMKKIYVHIYPSFATIAKPPSNGTVIKEHLQQIALELLIRDESLEHVYSASGFWRIINNVQLNK